MKATHSGFTMCPDSIVEEHGLITAAVYGKIARYASMKDGECSASQDRMAKELDISRRTFQRHAQILVDEQYISVRRTGGTNKYKTTDKLSIIVSVTESQQKRQKGATDAPESRTKKEVNKQDKKPKEETLTPHKRMVLTLAEVMGIDLDIGTHWSRYGKMAKSLLDADYTPEDIQAAFGSGGYWYKHDWRGKQKQLPNQKNIYDHIGVYSGRVKVETDTSPLDDLERRKRLWND